MPTLSNEQKAEMDWENAKNKGKQNEGATEASIGKQEAKKAAKKAAKKLRKEKNRNDKYERERKALNDLEFKKALKAQLKKYNIERLVLDFIKKIRQNIWKKSVAQIEKFTNKNLLVITCTRNGKMCIYIIEVNDGFPIDLSVYKNYIFPIMMLSLKLTSKELDEIVNSTKMHLSSVIDVPNTIGAFVTSTVIKPISLENPKYKKVVDKFASGMYEDERHKLYVFMRDELHKFLLNLGGVYYVPDKRKKPSKRKSSKDRLLKFYIRLTKYSVCERCHLNSSFNLKLDIGFDYRNQTYSFIYLGIAHSIFELKNLFQALLDNGTIRRNPICQGCCDKELQDKPCNSDSDLEDLEKDNIYELYCMTKQ